MTIVIRVIKDATRDSKLINMMKQSFAAVKECLYGVSHHEVVQYFAARPCETP